MFFVKLIDSCMRYHVSLDDDNDELLATVVDIATEAQFFQCWRILEPNFCQKLPLYSIRNFWVKTFLIRIYVHIFEPCIAIWMSDLKTFKNRTHPILNRKIISNVHYKEMEDDFWFQFRSKIISKSKWVPRDAICGFNMD